MSLKKLVNPGAFGQGADLWIIPNPEKSNWARKIDWYLNLQLLRANNHVPQILASELQSIIKENEMSLNSPSLKPNSALLINSRDHLPTRSVLHIPITGSKKEWLKQCFETWEKLNEPTVRFFLPPEIDDDFFENQWPKDKQYGVSYVSGTSPLEE
ncbi:MAG: hypothetical protein KDD34_09140 [Bdellovibrionales bacterium]|nr:hypothetical protein [Bdellovibrionales bacterium]